MKGGTAIRSFILMFAALNPRVVCMDLDFNKIQESTQKVLEHDHEGKIEENNRKRDHWMTRSSVLKNYADLLMGSDITHASTVVSIVENTFANNDIDGSSSSFSSSAIKVSAVTDYTQLPLLSIKENVETMTTKKGHYLPEFQAIALKYYIRRASHDPICILFSNQVSSLDLEKKIYRFWSGLSHDVQYGSWRIGFFGKNLSGIVLPHTFPMFTCYIGTAMPHDYHGNGTKKNLHKWFTVLSTLHSEQLPEANRSTIDDVITSSQYTLVAFPGEQKHYDVEMLLVLLSDKYNGSVQFLMVHPESVDGNALKRRFDVVQEPTVVVLEGQGWTKGSTKTITRFINDEVSLGNLEAFLMSQTTTTIVLTLQNFKKEVNEGWKSNNAILVCFHAPWGNDNSHYLDVFHHTQEMYKHLGVNLRFGLVDLVSNAEVVHRWIDASDAKSVPFTILFWFPNKHVKSTETVHQAILQSELPTPWNIAKFLQNQGVPLLDISGNVLDISLVSESSDAMFGVSPSHKMCVSNGNSTMDQMMLLEPFSKREPRQKMTESGTSAKEFKMKAKKPKQIGNILQITASNWHSLIETSKSHSDPLLPFSHQKTMVVSVSVVVFITDKCSNCARKRRVFEKIMKASKFIDGASVYIMNCSEDPEVCDRLQIRGFPTVSAFRTIREQGIEHCMPKDKQRLVRIDYHGYIEEKQIMDWFSHASLPATQLTDWITLEKYRLEDDIKDVRLVATILPRRLSYLYLRSADGHTTWFPYECFNVACENLFGIANCYSVISGNIPTRELKSQEDDFVVSQITMQRKDGVEALVFRANTALSLTLRDDSTKKLHKFHTPHRYNVRSNQRCEDDHILCTEVITSFVQDHSRLPVTHLTMDSFHTSTGFAMDHDSEGSIFTSVHPVLISLVHRANISTDSAFLKALTGAAYTLYNKIVITTLSVEEFPQWATRFVPHGYHRQVFVNLDDITVDLVPSLHIYPRLCIVHGNNHQRAAFYPSVEQFQLESKQAGRRITQKEIETFAQDFINNPQTMLIKAEHF